MKQLSILDIDPQIDPIAIICAELRIKRKILIEDPFIVCKYFGSALQWDKRMREWWNEENCFSPYFEYTTLDGSRLKHAIVRDKYVEQQT
jgi:hypothetical protein